MLQKRQAFHTARDTLTSSKLLSVSLTLANGTINGHRTLQKGSQKNSIFEGCNCTISAYYDYWKKSVYVMLEIRKDLAPFYLTTLLAHGCFLSNVTFLLVVNGSGVGWPMAGLDCPPAQPDEGCCSQAQAGLPRGGWNTQKRHTRGAWLSRLYVLFSDSTFSVGQMKTLALFYCSPAKSPSVPQKQ